MQNLKHEDSEQFQAWEKYESLLKIAQRAGNDFSLGKYSDCIPLFIELLKDHIDITLLKHLSICLTQCGYQELLDIVNQYILLIFSDAELHEVNQRQIPPQSLEKEIKTLFTPALSKPMVSFCMIIKNEEDKIIETLDAVAPLIDEFIIVDTGSTDKSIELLQQYSQQIEVFHEPWKNDFSAARNVFMEQATGDWIFYLDADERLSNESLEYLKEFFRYKPVGINGFLIEEYSYGSAPELDFVNQALRIFPNHSSLCFYGAIHNQLYRRDSPFPIQTLQLPSVSIVHTGYQNNEVNLKKTAQRSQILKASMDHSEVVSPYFRYKYASDLLTFLKEKEALEQLEICWNDTQKHYSTPPVLPWFPAPLNMVSLLIFGLLYETKNFSEMLLRYPIYKPHCHFAEFQYLYAEVLFYHQEVIQSEAICYQCFFPEIPVFHPKGGYKSWKPILLLLNIATHRKDLLMVAALSHYLFKLSPTQCVKKQMSVVLSNLNVTFEQLLASLKSLSIQHSQQEQGLLSCILYLLLHRDENVMRRLLGHIVELKLFIFGKAYKEFLMASGQSSLVKDIHFDGQRQDSKYEGLLWYLLHHLKNA